MKRDIDSTGDVPVPSRPGEPADSPHHASRRATKSVDRRLRSYLMRKAQEQQNIIDSVPVFSKRYGAAVDDLEEIEELLSPRRKEACRAADAV